MKKIWFFSIGILILSANFFTIAAQNGERLEANKEKEFVLNKNEEKAFTLDLKEDAYAEVFWEEKGNNDLSVSITSPSGRDVLKNVDFNTAFPFVAAESGVYKLLFKPSQYNENIDKWNVKVGYDNVFKLPKSAKLQRQRKINGYDIKVYNSAQEGDDGAYGTYLLIEKNGKLREILRGGSLVGGGFNFADDPKLWDYAEGKKSATLFHTTLDKTGEGTPDVAVQFYTGGAHCCYKMYIYELGADKITAVSTINGDDSDIIAVGKKAKGGLAIKTGDSNFAYWLTSFAGSPIPTVILSYKNGEFRPDLQLMKRRAPTAAVLKAKAAKAKKNMDLKAYTGEKDNELGFGDAFWGEMLDFLYADNEIAAWQYFDWVWDSRKPGKEIFKEDFIKKLNESEYWKMMQEDKK